MFAKIMASRLKSFARTKMLLEICVKYSMLIRVNTILMTCHTLTCHTVTFEFLLQYSMLTEQCEGVLVGRANYLIQLDSLISTINQWYMAIKHIHIVLYMLPAKNEFSQMLGSCIMVQ